MCWPAIWITTHSIFVRVCTLRCLPYNSWWMPKLCALIGLGCPPQVFNMNHQRLWCIKSEHQSNAHMCAEVHTFRLPSIPSTADTLSNMLGYPHRPQVWLEKKRNFLLYCRRQLHICVFLTHYDWGGSRGVHHCGEVGVNWWFKQEHRRAENKLCVT